MYLRAWVETVTESEPGNVEHIQRDRLFSRVKVGENLNGVEGI